MFNTHGKWRRMYPTPRRPLRGRVALLFALLCVQLKLGGETLNTLSLIGKDIGQIADKVSSSIVTNHGNVCCRLYDPHGVIPDVIDQASPMIVPWLVMASTNTYEILVYGIIHY